MSKIADRKFDWIAGLALVSGAAVMIPSIVALVFTVIVAAAALF